MLLGISIQKERDYYRLYKISGKQIFLIGGDFDPGGQIGS